MLSVKGYLLNKVHFSYNLEKNKNKLSVDLFFINSNILREAGQFDLAPDQYSLHSRPASQTGSYRYLLLAKKTDYLH